MAEFRYKAYDVNGQRRDGIMKGPDRSLVQTRLARMRLQVITLHEVSGDLGGRESIINLAGGRVRIDKSGNIFLSFSDPNNVPDRDIIVFTKQLATMIASGVPLNQSLDILGKQQANTTFSRIILGSRQSIEEGSKFSDALAAYPKTFDNLFIAMVRAGEESGKLAEILFKLVVYVEKASKIKRQIKSAMMYPAMIMVVAVIVISGLLIFVIPTFTQQFRDSGKELPALTQYVINFSDFLIAKWYIIMGATLVVFQAFKLWVKTPPGRQSFHAFALKAPVIGDLVKKIAVGRFCSTMASMLTAGVNIIQALSICAASAGNVVIEKFIMYARGRVEQGQLLSQPISENKLFPPMVVSMMEVGEKAGRLDEMLLKVSDFYEEEVDEAVKAMLGMIEPLLIVFIGGIVGILVAAMYLPILDLGNAVGG